jgi:sugar (pentulose or hexulose) kinase
VPLRVIAIFDIGKTNKKVFLFNEDYEIVYEETEQFAETRDEDGDPCEDVEKLSSWLSKSIKKLFEMEKFKVEAMNFSAYGASFVYIDADGNVLTPLYNYLKSYPKSLIEDFYAHYGGEDRFCLETASPALGSLNSGLQLYRMKKEKSNTFGFFKYALHLPQFVSYLVTGKAVSDITSIGCHTALWDFSKKDYHEWVVKEDLIYILPPIVSTTTGISCNWQGQEFTAGIGLHDSSAALIPYLVSFREPFVLISTGTWSISLNPFNQSPLTVEELKQDCLCNLSFEGKPVKTARLFAGYEHDQQVKRITEHFNKPKGYYKQVRFNPVTAAKLRRGIAGSLSIEERDLSVFEDFETAYHQLMLELISKQQHSTDLVLKGTDVKRIFVDGGFSQNSVYMHLLAEAFPAVEVYAASIPQASALGAALAVHQHWNNHNVPKNLIGLQHFAAGKTVVES